MNVKVSQLFFKNSAARVITQLVNTGYKTIFERKTGGLKQSNELKSYSNGNVMKKIRHKHKFNYSRHEHLLQLTHIALRNVHIK